jgi:hypothetical protein
MRFLLEEGHELLMPMTRDAPLDDAPGRDLQRGE